MSDELKQAMLQPPAGPADIFGVAYLQLCQISYALPSCISSLVANNMPPFSPGGRWECVWGPAESEDLANLVFVAAYHDGPNQPPVFAAVVTRGTDVDVSDIWGVLQQAFEDFYVAFQSPPSWLSPDSPALVADGTLFALETIQGFSSGGVSLLSFLTAFLSAPANQNPVLICTGHSLGGCVTTVVAPWLQASLGLSNPIVPATFAAPTAGNGAFADYYTSTFRYCPRYVNELDVAPLAWGDLDAVPALYDPCSLQLSDADYLLLLSWEGAMDLAGASYSQQQSSNVPLTGSCLTTTSPDWLSQAAAQHHTYTYMGLLGGTSVAIPQNCQLTLARPKRRVSHYRLQARMRSGENLLSRRKTR